MKIIPVFVLVIFNFSLLSSADSTTVLSSDSSVSASGKSDTQPVNTSSESKDISVVSASDSSVKTDGNVNQETSTEDAVSDTATVTSTDTSTIDTASEETVSSENNSSAIIDETEEELILDGGEESIILPAVAEKPAVDSVDSTADSSKTTQEAVSTDTARAAATDSSKKNIPRFPVSPMPTQLKTEEEPAPQLKINKMKSINFAKNLKDYRSPKMAILLSLLFPGAGQAYAKNYLKSGIFGAVEIALITAGSVMGVKGSDQLEDAHKFADKHYSVESFESYYTSMSNNLQEEDIAEIFLDEGEVDTFYSDAKKKNQSYYNYIGFQVSPYIHGWDDATPRFDSDFEPINDDDDGEYIADAQQQYLIYYIKDGDTVFIEYGRSEHQDTYNKKVTKANDSYRWSKNFFTILVINHLASAIDAAITAKAYNDKLLGKTSFLNNINIREKVVSTPVETANGLALEVRF